VVSSAPIDSQFKTTITRPRTTPACGAFPYPFDLFSSVLALFLAFSRSPCTFSRFRLYVVQSTTTPQPPSRTHMHILHYITYHKPYNPTLKQIKKTYMVKACDGLEHSSLDPTGIVDRARETIWVAPSNLSATAPWFCCWDSCTLHWKLPAHALLSVYTQIDGAYMRR
jgi:hypothetical protein